MEFEYTAEGYAAIMLRRLAILAKLRDPKLTDEERADRIAILKAYYREEPWQMVADWGMTYDPRNQERNVPATIPFIPFPRQVELMRWIVAKWKASEPGLVPKSRDTGASWCAVALSCVMCLMYDGMAIGFGSRKEEYVDKLDAPKSLFYKARVFMKGLPVELRGGWTEKGNGHHMRITFPQSGSVMTGEAGDNIGRGDRCGIYYVDESAHLERPQLAEEALSATTNCRIDMSSVKGMDNPFAVKAHSWPAERIFLIHWRDDPRKNAAWYAELQTRLDAVTIAQEYDINYSASVAGVVIPAEWVQAAIDAHIKLGIEVSGARVGGLDVADEGTDLNAYAGRHGILLDYCEAWSGVGSDIMATTKRAFGLAAELRHPKFRYDADGLGAGVRGDARTLNEARKAENIKEIEVEKHQGSGAVIYPDKPIPSTDVPDGSYDREERINKDYFKNYKAQSWWHLRLRFQRTFRAVTQGAMPKDMGDLISISSAIPQLTKLCQELSQPTYGQDNAGKMLINKQPDGSRSPNYGDAVNIAFAPVERIRGFFDLD